MNKKIFFMLLILFSSGCVYKKNSLIKEFSSLSQDEKRRLIPLMLDSVDHEMYGIGFSKTKEELRKNGGHSGYYISHYPMYTSGGLTIPVLRVYNHKGKMIDTLIGSPLSKDGKSIMNLGGFSKPYDFHKIRINHPSMDKTEEIIRRNIINGTNAEEKAQYFTPDFFQNIDDNYFVNLNSDQDAISGKGYDTDCIATAIRETYEEAGIKLKKDGMVLLDIHSSVLDQETKSGYKIQTSSTGVCYFMFEMGRVYLNEKGKISHIKLSNASIANTNEVHKNISYDEYNNIKLEGFDDASNGIVFARLSSLHKVFAGNKKSYHYYIKDYQDNEFKVVSSIGDAIALTPLHNKYQICQPILFRTIGKFLPSTNNIGAQETISSYMPKTLCNLNAK